VKGSISRRDSEVVAPAGLVVFTRSLGEKEMTAVDWGIRSKVNAIPLEAESHSARRQELFAFPPESAFTFRPE